MCFACRLTIAWTGPATERDVQSLGVLQWQVIFIIASTLERTSVCPIDKTALRSHIGSAKREMV